MEMIVVYIWPLRSIHDEFVLRLLDDDRERHRYLEHRGSPQNVLRLHEIPRPAA